MPGIRAHRALALAACALAIGGCGSEEQPTIPREQGETMLAQLDAIEDAVRNRQCDAAASTALEFATTVGTLPEDVDVEVRDALAEASANLRQLTTDPEQCSELETGATGPPPPEETTTETTTTETTTEEEPPPEDDEGEGQGPPEEPPGGGMGDPGGGNSDDDDDGGSSGGIGSE